MAIVAIPAYLFDYGGTLDGEGWHWFDRFVHLYRQAGSELPDGRIKEAFYSAEASIAAEAAAEQYRIRRLVERHVELQAEILGSAARGLAADLVRGFLAINEEGWARAREALGRLKPRARLGVVSNFYGNLQTILEEAGLAPLLDDVVESSGVGLEKPDPRIYRLAIERLGVAPGEAAMVGDNFERDIRPAKAIGLTAIWLRRGNAAPPEPGVADRVISALAELV